MFTSVELEITKVMALSGFQNILTILCVSCVINEVVGHDLSVSYG